MSKTHEDRKPKLEEPEPGKEQEFKVKWWEKLREILEEEGVTLA